VSVKELRRAVTLMVATSTQELQHPTVDRDNISVEFGFPIVKP